MKTLTLPVVLALALLPATLIWVVCDAFHYHRMIAADYKTPWYSASWLAQPYTNLRLALQPAREYWTMNAIKTEQWRIRETAVDNVVFWTALERIPADARPQS